MGDKCPDAARPAGGPWTGDTFIPSVLAIRDAPLGSTGTVEGETDGGQGRGAGNQSQGLPRAGGGGRSGRRGHVRGDVGIVAVRIPTRVRPGPSPGPTTGARAGGRGLRPGPVRPRQRAEDPAVR